MSREQPIWYCACLIHRDGIAVYSYGKKFKSELTARVSARRVFRVLNTARMDGHWAIGVGRSFNRDARPSSVVWATPGDPTIPEFPPLPPVRM